jgi:hypothetical protein
LNGLLETIEVSRYDSDDAAESRFRAYSSLQHNYRGFLL